MIATLLVTKYSEYLIQNAPTDCLALASTMQASSRASPKSHPIQELVLGDYLPASPSLAAPAPRSPVSDAPVIRKPSAASMPIQTESGAGSSLHPAWSLGLPTFSGQYVDFGQVFARDRHAFGNGLTKEEQVGLLLAPFH